MSFKSFLKEINGSRVEGELIRTVFYSLLTSIITALMVYFLFLRSINDFIPKYGNYLFLSILSYALIIPTIRHTRAYKQFGCMSGMMIGMTLGMISGFLAGFFVGATNGMFVGGVFGMFVGIFLGSWIGSSSCGVMGFMEGIMAGFMGGLMGAMTSVMLLNDHLLAASIIVFFISMTIMIALHYMIFYEMKQESRQRKEGHLITISLSFLLTIITIYLMAYGPRSFLFN